MAAVTSLPKSRKAVVKILNPMPGGSEYTSLDRARKFVEKGRAHFDCIGRLVFHGRSVSKPGAALSVTEYDGVCDVPQAFKDRAIMPPSAEVLRRMNDSGGRGRYIPPADLLRRLSSARQANAW